MRQVSCPIAVFLQRLEEAVGDADGVVGVLARDGVVGFAVEIVIELEAEFLGQFLLLLGKGLEAFDQRGHLQFFAHFPIDEHLDVRVIEIEAAPSCGPAGGAARFDRAGGAVADLAGSSSGPMIFRRRESGSFSPRRREKLEPVPEPYLKSRASRVHRSMMPPGFTRSSLTLWMKQLWTMTLSHRYWPDSVWMS